MPDIFKLFAEFILNLVEVEKSTRLYETLHFFIMDVFKIFTLMGIVIFISGYLRSSLTEERIRKAVGGKNRIISYPIAVLLGAITPFCSCSSIPLFIGFIQSGIPLDITMAFLITSPMINELGFFVFGSTIGWDLAITYAITGLAIGIIGGYVIKLLNMEKYVERLSSEKKTCCCCKNGNKKQEPKLTQKQKIAYGANEVKSIIKKIGIYVIVGIGFGAVIHGYVPKELMAEYASKDNPFSVLIAVLAGIPVYANHTGVIPVIEALLSKGVPVGTSLAFMMSVSAISLPEMIILRRVLKPRLILAFALTLFFCFLAVGYMFNYLF